LRNEGLSEMRSCVLAHIGRSSYRYRSHPRGDRALAELLKAYSERHKREGYRKAHGWLRAQGHGVNHKRVERIWRCEGLCVPKKKRRRRRGKSAEPRPERAERPNHVWTCDFMEDSCVTGRKLRFLNVMDEFTREGLATDVARSFPAERAAEVLARLVRERGAPEFIRSDNGTEFVAKAMEKWREDIEVKSIFIEPGKPWQNGLCESFNSRMREECLNMELFYGVRDARATVEAWRRYYNEERPHGALGYQSPLEFKRKWLAEEEKTGALPPAPRDLSHCCSKQKEENSGSRRNGKGGANSSAAPSASRPATALRSLPSGALPSVRTRSQYCRTRSPATKTIDERKSSHSELS
jgi:transposase InsO family protein